MKRICIVLALLSAAIAVFAGPAKDNESRSGSAITGITVNTTVHGDGQKIESITIIAENQRVLQGLTAGDFKFTGNTGGWGSNFPVGSDPADPMAYVTLYGANQASPERTPVIEPFTPDISGIAVDGNKITLRVSNFSPKLYYVKDFTIECTNKDLSFSNRILPVLDNSGRFGNSNSKVTVVTPTADEFAYIKVSKSGSEPTDYNYFLFTPRGAGSKPLPLVLSNHGSGDQMTLVANRVTLAWAEPGVQAENPSYVLAPVYPQGDYENTQVTTIVRTIALIEQLIAQGKVDPARIYIEGKSMGGKNTVKIASLYPDFFAAALPLCPASILPNSSSQAEYADDYKKIGTILKDLPIWFVVGRNDALSPHSQGYYNALTAAGSYKAKLLMYTPEQMLARGIFKAHDNEIISLEDSRYSDWLFAQRKVNKQTDAIDYIRLNTWSAPRGHTIKTIDIYVNNPAVLSNIRSPADFGGKITGNTYNYSSRSLPNGEYRTNTLVPYEAKINNVVVSGNKVTLTLDPIKGYIGDDLSRGIDNGVGGFKKFYYAKDITLTCTANNALSFTRDRRIEENTGGLAVNDITTETADKFAQFSSKHTASFDYNLYAPDGVVTGSINDVKAEHPAPLVLVMHGSGDQGTLLANRMAIAIAESHPEAYVLTPIYVNQNSVSGKTEDSVANQWVTTGQSIDLIKRMIDIGLVDSKRVYLIGKSMGGKNVQRTYVRYPDFFAATISLSGSIAQEFVKGDPDTTNATAADVTVPGFVDVLKNKPFYIICAVGDPINSSDTTPNGGKTTQSRALRDAIIAANGGTAPGTFKYQEYSAENLTRDNLTKDGLSPSIKPHDVEIICMEDPQFLNWMFSQSLSR
ncbi:prolyl oligopeptidase family serine peptidase [Treponema primitia]|nr:prolyl oligopeptidase family serine peptidase [Treponema primitia]